MSKGNEKDVVGPPLLIRESYKGGNSYYLKSGGKTPFLSLEKWEKGFIKMKFNRIDEYA